MSARHKSADEPIGRPVDPASVEHDLWQAFAEQRHPNARHQLIEHYLPFARPIAAALFARRGPLLVDFMDYMQLATIGLIEAIDRYDRQNVIRLIQSEVFGSTD